MKFQINKLELLEALTVTGKAINPTGILPILSSYLFAIDNDKIRITGGANDLMIHYNLEIVPCSFTKALAIPKSKLLDLISDSPNQPIEFEIKESEVDGKISPSSIKITTSIGKYVIPTVGADDYPVLSIENPTSFNVPKESLLKGIESTLFACSNDELRPAITGVNFIFDGESMDFAATNTHVLSTRTMQVRGKADTIRNMILPKKIVNVLLGMPADEDIEVMVTDKNVRFRVSQSVTVESVLIAGKYVDYPSVIPRNLDGHFVIRKAALLGSIKRVNRFSDLGTSQLVIEITAGNCNISTSNDFGENANENLELDYKGEGVRIGMSGKFLIDSLNRIKTDNVSVSFGQANKPFILRESDKHTVLNSAENLILVMPMMLNN